MDKKDLRSRNLLLLRKALQGQQRLTKPQAAVATGLSVVTVNSLMQELVAEGEAMLIEEAASSGGRPAQCYAFCAEKRLALTAYMHEKAGKDTLFIAVLDLLGRVVERQELQPEHVDLALFSTVLKPYFRRYPQLAVVLVGLPGMEVHGRLAVIDYPALQDLAFCQQLQEILQCPVYLENDINAAVLGYTAKLGEAAAQETVVGIYLPQNYPPGAGISLQGRIYKGRDGMAGEIGNRLRFWSGDGIIAGQDAAVLARIAELVVLFTVTWNPHRLVLYRETLQPGDLRAIQTLAAGTFAAEFLPALEVKASIYEDYGRGIQQLAMAYLNKE